MRCSAHTIKHSDFLPPLPRCFVSSLRGTANAPWTSLPRPQGATAAGLGLFTGIPETGFLDGDDRTSQVPGGPRYKRALLFDPGGDHCARPLPRIGVVF